MAKTYAEKLRDPRWQKKRLEIFERDSFQCRSCGDKEKTLNVHHLKYHPEPWDSPNAELLTLCDDCHSQVEALKKEIGTLLCDGYKMLCFKELISVINLDNGGRVLGALCHFKDPGFATAIGGLLDWHYGRGGK